LKGLQIRGVEDLLGLPLIEFEDTSGLAPWLSWKVWCEAMGIARPHTGSGLMFSHYDQVVQAAVAGQGVALGRFPLLDPLVAERRLALPLRGRQYATLAASRLLAGHCRPRAAHGGQDLLRNGCATRYRRRPRHLNGPAAGSSVGRRRVHRRCG
jgi:DNA-binding transcriptional LysR family regulator